MTILIQRRDRGFKTKAENTTWVIEYNDKKDHGFRLFNPSQFCYLASSFRQFPDWDADNGRDLVEKQLKMVVEVTCTRGASAQASTFYTIEGRVCHFPLVTVAGL